jgi:hypothetical protein
MRLLLIVVLGVAGYFGYNYYTNNKQDVDQRIAGIIASAKGEKVADEATESAEGAEEATGLENPSPGGQRPSFESKIDVPTPPAGEKQYAPPGVFYVVDRVTVETSTGVKALSPGEKVKLLQRLNSGRMKVTTGEVDFEVKETQVTNDLDLARDAEKKDFVARGGVL